MTNPASNAELALWLADSAEFQSSEPIDPPGLHEEGGMWRIGTLRFWKHEPFRQTREMTRNSSPFPSYRRASLEWDLLPDMRLEIEPFLTKEGLPAFAILLRSEKDPEGTFGTFTLDEHEASRIVHRIHSDMDATRRIALERFEANGGDPEAVAGRRAPSAVEMLDALEGALGRSDAGE